MSAITHAPEQHRAAVEDYFELKTYWEERHEYIDGEIIPQLRAFKNIYLSTNLLIL